MIRLADFDLSYEPEKGYTDRVGHTTTNPAYFHLTTHGDNQAAIDPVEALRLAEWIQKVMAEFRDDEEIDPSQPLTAP